MILQNKQFLAVLCFLAGIASVVLGVLVLTDVIDGFWPIVIPLLVYVLASGLYKKASAAD